MINRQVTNHNTKKAIGDLVLQLRPTMYSPNRKDLSLKSVKKDSLPDVVKYSEIVTTVSS